MVIGDTAHVRVMNGKPLPGIAPVAKQQALYVAKLIRARIKGWNLPAFLFRDPGALATVGRKRAVVQFRGIRLSGYFAWWLRCLAHIYFLIGLRNRLVVAINWAWTYASLQRGTRLITGRDLLERSGKLNLGPAE